MAQLRRDYQKFLDRNAEVIAIGPEDAKSFAFWWHEHKMPFIGIADPEHIIARSYGQQVKLFKFGRMPASFVVDKEGKIRYQHFGESMSDIPKTRLFSQYWMNSTKKPQYLVERCHSPRYRLHQPPHKNDDALSSEGTFAAVGFIIADS